MKWIGQHIYDQVSKFRNDVYLEGISTSTETDMLVVDSNNKVSKRAIDAITVDVSDFMTNGANNYVVTATGTDAMNAEANLQFNGSTLALTGDLTVTGDTATFTSANADDPAFIIQNTTDDNQAARLQFIKNRGADGEDNDNVAELEFWGYNDAGTPELQQYGKIVCKIDDATDSEESGAMVMTVASHNGGMREFIRATGGSLSNETDVIIGNTATSLTTISGTLTMGSTATINNSGVIQVAAQTVIDHDQLANFAANEHFTQANITTVGTIGTGVWNGTAISSEYMASATIGAAGAVELATSAETLTGTDTSRAVTAEGVATVHATAQTGKNYRILNCSFRDDIGTTLHYLPLKSQDEQTVLTREEATELSVCDGRVVSVTLRVENLNTHSGDATVTFGVTANVVGTGYDNFTEVETEAVTINDGDDSHLYHAVFSTAKHWDSTDMFAISITSDTDISGSNERFFVTVVIEDDWSTYLAGSTREIDSTP